MRNLRANLLRAETEHRTTLAQASAQLLTGAFEAVVEGEITCCSIEKGSKMAVQVGGSRCSSTVVFLNLELSIVLRNGVVCLLYFNN